MQTAVVEVVVLACRLSRAGRRVSCQASSHQPCRIGHLRPWRTAHPGIVCCGPCAVAELKDYPLDKHALAVKIADPGALGDLVSASPFG